MNNYNAQKLCILSNLPWIQEGKGTHASLYTSNVNPGDYCEALGGMRREVPSGLYLLMGDGATALGDVGACSMGEGQRGEAVAGRWSCCPTS